ncbi:MAG: hypothetical protein COA84_15095 [Robiginitomaculum sp.]|nr:MAG: hypothetical protein COA84_15095 [Robiginitomaculum sp.]
MTKSIGNMKARMSLDGSDFQKGMAQMRRSARAFGRDMQRMGRNMSLYVSGPLAAIGALSVRAAGQQEQAIAGVRAALTSMGDAAGYNLEQLQNMASQMQENSLFGDEDILSKVTANLLTFGKIHTSVFERAQQLSLDLSARLGQDLQSSAVMLGKALNDPVQGLTALTRVGITFTDQQKAMIREMAAAGDIIGAQTIMLEELERQYSGQAAALADLDSGKIVQAMNSIGDAAEKVGAILLPMVARFADFAKRMAEKFQALHPVFQRMIIAIAALGAATGPVLITIALFTTAVGAISAPVLMAVGAVAALTVGLVALFGGSNDVAAAASVAASAETSLKDALTSVNRVAPAAAQSAIELAKTRIELAKASVVAAKAELRLRQSLHEETENAPDSLLRTITLALSGGVVDNATSELEEQIRRLTDEENMLNDMSVLSYVSNFSFGSREGAGQELDSMTVSLQRLIETLDPAIAAENDFLDVKRQLNEALDAGAIDQEQYTHWLSVAEDRMNGVTAASGGAATGISDIEEAARKAAAELERTAQEAESFTAQIGGSFGNSMSSLFDDFLEGTVDARSALHGLASDLAKMAMNSIFKDLLSGLNGGSGGGGGFLSGLLGSLAGARAAGGPVMAGQSYLVGENQPEIFVPNVSGTILPDADMASLGGATVAQNVTLKNINVFDPSIVGDYLQTSAGERLMMNIMQKNGIA